MHVAQTEGSDLQESIRERIQQCLGPTELSLILIIFVSLPLNLRSGRSLTPEAVSRCPSSANLPETQGPQRPSQRLWQVAGLRPQFCVVPDLGAVAPGLSAALLSLKHLGAFDYFRS